MEKLFGCISEQGIKAKLNLSDAKSVLEHISALLRPQVEDLQEDILHLLHQREKLSSTALGEGTAIPHATIANITHPKVCLLSLSEGVNFDGPDDRPVDLFLGLLLPADHAVSSQEILKIAATILRDGPLCHTLRECDNDKGLYQAFLMATVIRDE